MYTHIYTYPYRHYTYLIHIYIDVYIYIYIYVYIHAPANINVQLNPTLWKQNQATLQAKGPKPASSAPAAPGARSRTSAGAASPVPSSELGLLRRTLGFCHIDLGSPGCTRQETFGSSRMQPGLRDFAGQGAMAGHFEDRELVDLKFSGPCAAGFRVSWLKAQGSVQLPTRAVGLHNSTIGEGAVA